MIKNLYVGIEHFCTEVYVLFTFTMHQTVKYEKHSLLVLHLQYKTFPGLTYHEIAEIAT